MEEITSQLPSQESQISISPPKPKGKIVKVVIGIIIVLILGLGISLYTRALDPLWNPFRPEPEEVISEMSKKMGEVKTLHSETKIDFLTKEETEEKFKISMDFWNDSDATDKENPKSAGNFSLSLAIEGMQFSLGGESIVIGKDSYFKITTFPLLPPEAEIGLQMLGIDISELRNQWIKFDEKSAQNLLESLGIPITPGIEEKMPESEKRQEELIQKFQALLKDKKLYIVKKEFTDKKIRNQNIYHYLIALNREEIKNLIPQLFKTLIEIGVFPQPQTETEWQEFQREFPAEFDKFFQKIGDIEGQIWIGKKDLYLYKIKGEKEIDLAKIDPAAKGKIAVKLDIDFSDFNQPVKIEAPAEFKTLEEIFPIGEMISESLLESQSRARDARRKSDLHQIATAMELYYGENGRYLQSYLMPDAIGTYLDPVPVEPDNSPCSFPISYEWVPNERNSQKFCIFACLENGKFYAVSHKGFRELNNPPSNLDCW